jgi:4'-phosphopantetheinyl transferase
MIPTKQLVDDPIYNMTWKMRSFMPKVGCSGALCHHPTIREIRYGLIHLAQHASLQF